MASRSFALVLVVAVLSSGIVGGVVALRAHQAEEALGRAGELLGAPLSEVAELHDLEGAEAKALVERAVELGSGDRRTRGLGEYADALVQLQRGDLVLAEGALGSARQLLGWTADLHVLAAALHRARGRHGEAREHVASALSLEPDHRRAALLRADLALDRGQGVVARRVLETLSEQEPEVAAVHNRLGLAHELLGEEREAERAFHRATEVDAEHADAWINLGRLHRRRGQSVRGRRAFERALSVAPGSVDAHLGRGLTALDGGELDLAERTLGRAAELAPEASAPVLALGDVAVRRGDFEEAVRLYREAIGRDGGSAAAWVKLGNALVRSREPGAAAAAFRRAIERDAGLAAAHNGLGAALMHTGDLEAASASFERAAELDPADPNPLRNLALLQDR